MPAHIKATPEQIAERVIIAGDPARVRQLSEMLENPRLVNENRGFLVYTGEYDGVPITVATHGIGAPSAAIVIEELAMLGAKVIVRLGTAGALIKGLHVGDPVIVTGAAYYPGGTISAYVPDGAMPAVPHHEVLMELIRAAREEGLRATIGPVVSSDAFYAEDPEFAKRWASRGIVAVEMECATLFILGLLRRLKTGALVVVSDSLVEEAEKELATAEQLREPVSRAAKVVLRALTRVEP